MTNSSEITRTGGCQCGEIRYESRGEPIALYVCHCRECQKQSGSAFGISLEVLRSSFRITQGIPKYWNRSTEKGRQLKCAFCSTCGSRPWHESVTNLETISIKGGTLNQPLDISNAIHVWVSRKLPGVIIPDNVKQYPEED